MTKKERARKAVNALKERYPDAICSLEYEKPYELLISTRLSAQCTDARVNIVTKALFAKYPTLEAFAEAELKDVEAIVKPCGFYHMKARDIIAMSKTLLKEYDGILPDSVEELTRLSGVGRKTANLIVGDVYHKPAVVTDTHCIRICGRLGLTSGTEEPKKVEDELRKILDPKESSDFCHRLVLFGRDICSARSPKCNGCPLSAFCKSAGKPDIWKKKKTRLKKVASRKLNQEKK